MSDRREIWRWTRRVLFAAFLIAVGMLLFQQARKVDWSAVGQTLLALQPSILALAVAMAVASYLLYGCFDLLGRHYVGHRIARWRVLAIGAISYAFNLNIGALVGSAGFRYRLYTRHGLGTADTTRVIALSISGNWSGYVLLGGLLLSVQRLEVPEQWALGAQAMQWLGVLMLIAAAAYPLLCAFSPRREWTIRGHVIELPSLRIALLQMLLSTANWLLIATILWLLLPSPLGYANVLGALLIAAVGGAIAHIPAGLGVLEAVFVMLFADSVGSAPLIAGLMGYRGIYYLMPLIVATGLYVMLERQPPRIDPRTRNAPERAKNRGPGITAGAPAHPDEG